MTNVAKCVLLGPICLLLCVFLLLLLRVSNLIPPYTRQHPSYGDYRLEVRREYCQNSSVLDEHIEQFLQVQQIGFVTLGPLHCAQRQLPRVVLL